MSPYRRRRYLISKLQVRLLLIIAAYGLVAVLALGGLVFLPLALDVIDQEASDAERAKAGAIFLAMDLRLWPAVAALLIAIGGHAILLTHRIVGPLYRFSRVMGAAARGDHTVLANLRERDLLHAEAEVLNELLRSVRFQWETVSEETERLRETLSHRPGSADSGEQEVFFRELTECVERLEAHLEGRAGASSDRAGMDGDHEPSAALPVDRSADTAALGGGP